MQGIDDPRINDQGNRVQGHFIMASSTVAKSYMRKGFLLYEEKRKYFPKYEEAVMTLQLLHSLFPYIWGKFDFLFYQCIMASSTVCPVSLLYTCVKVNWTELQQRCKAVLSSPSLWARYVIDKTRTLRVWVGPPAIRSAYGGQCVSQWRPKEGWTNTASRLAGWRRVTRQVWFCTWWTGWTACLFRTVPGWQELPSCELMKFQLLLYSKPTQPSVMSYVTQGRHGLVSSRSMPSLCCRGARGQPRNFIRGLYTVLVHIATERERDLDGQK